MFWESFNLDNTFSTFALVKNDAPFASAESIPTSALRSIKLSIVGAKPLVPPATDPIPVVNKIPFGVVPDPVPAIAAISISWAEEKKKDERKFYKKKRLKQ